MENVRKQKKFIDVHKIKYISNHSKMYRQQQSIKNVFNFKDASLTCKTQKIRTFQKSPLWTLIQ